MSEVKMKLNDLRNRKFYTKELEQEATTYGYRWLKVAALILKDDKFILVREAKVQDENGEWQDGDGGWNLPAGRVMIDEDTFAATEREIREESGCVVKLKGICQIGQSTKAKNPYTIITFLAQSITEYADFDPDEIKEVKAFTEAEIVELEEAGRLRSPHLVKSAIENYKAGICSPLETLRVYR